MSGRGRSTSPQRKSTGRSPPSGSGFGRTSAPLSPPPLPLTSAPLSPPPLPLTSAATVTPATGALQQLRGLSHQVRPSGGLGRLGPLGPPGGPSLFSQDPVPPNPADGPLPTQDVPDVPFVRLMGFDNASAKVKDFISFTEGEANDSIYGKINTVSNLLDWILYLLRQYISLGLSEAELYDLKRYIKTKLAHMGGEMDNHLKRKAMYIVDLLNYHIPDGAPPALDANGNVLPEPKFPLNPYDNDVATTDAEGSSQLLNRGEDTVAARRTALQTEMTRRNTERQLLINDLQRITQDTTMSNQEKRDAYAARLAPRSIQERRVGFSHDPIAFPPPVPRGGKRKTNMKRKTRSKKIGKRNTRR